MSNVSQPGHCVSCGGLTELVCAECAIKEGLPVFVCGQTSCRNAHELIEMKTYIPSLVPARCSQLGLRLGFASDLKASVALLKAKLEASEDEETWMRGAKEELMQLQRALGKELTVLVKLAERVGNIQGVPPGSPSDCEGGKEK